MDGTDALLTHTYIHIHDTKEGVANEERQEWRNENCALYTIALHLYCIALHHVYLNI